MSTRLPPRRSTALKLHIRDLNLAPIQRYVDIQTARGRLLRIGSVDVDVEPMFEQPFLCDRHRCIQWTPHDDKAKAEPLIDRSCCSRYAVPVMDLDRQKVEKILPLVRKRLDKDHPLNTEPDLPFYEIDDDYSMVMRDQGHNVCQFVLYEEGRTTCSIHKTCIEEKLPVAEYKPVGCSLWPVALVDYEAVDVDGNKEQRYLLTVYGETTKALFEGGSEQEESEEDHFACIVDKNPAYEPMYKGVEDVLTYLLGKEFWGKLDDAAQQHLGRKRKAKPAREKRAR